MKEMRLLEEMIEYEKGVPKRIQHFTKVYTYCRQLGEMEEIDKRTQNILCVAALVHDIGIKKALKVYGSSGGIYQEELGPDLAREMLEKLGYEKTLIERVCYLVGNHHSYNQINGIDYQILVEADFLVNFYEDACSKEAIQKVYDDIFKTNSGKWLCRTMFG